MATVPFDNDDQIHHFEGKAPQDACPLSTPLASNTPGTSSPVSKSSFFAFPPPGMQVTYHQKMRGILRKIIGMSKPSTPLFQKNVSYNIIVAPRFINYNSITNNKNMGFINNFNNYGIMVGHVDNFYNGTAEKHEEQEAAESSEEDKDAKVSAVQPETVNEKLENQMRDYSKSSIFPILTYQEHANYLIGWMHLNIDNQKKSRERVKVIKALESRSFFKGKVSYNDYIDEFGNTLSSSWYSKLMNMDFPTTELDAALESLDITIFNLEN